MRRTVVVVLLGLLAACGNGDGDGVELGDDEERPMAVQAETVAKGSQGPRDPGEIVARTADEFRRAWAEHDGADPPSLDGVDFGSEMVIAVFQGEQPSAGYGVEIASVTTGGRVRYVASKPDPATCVTAAVITSPFHVVAVPAVDGDVEFEREERTVTC